ncbi:prion-inhibition and propagation-domain-containing protein [Xylaria palmicola]|nr:prion-inhibition and propagation-domain-containing protein [Xylaria palmicola]
MAELAASVVGISGVVGVLQNLLQCYRDFLTARDFGDDYAYLKLRTALLENSTTTWGAAVGLIDEHGAPGNKFLVARPTEENARLVETTLRLIHERLEATNAQLATYTSNTPVTQAPPAGAVALIDKPSSMTRAADKLHRIVHRYRDEQHPGTLNRTIWALVDKTRLDDNLNQATKLMDRLNADFAPVNQKLQLDRYCQEIKDLELDAEEVKAVRENARDQLSQRVLQMLENERLTGNRFQNMQFSGDGSVNVGDYYDKDWSGGSIAVPQRNDTYDGVSVTDNAFLNVGNTYGGVSPFQARFASRQARNGGSAS